MAYDTLNELLTGIANAIRTVEESTGTINAQDFPSRIASLSNSPSDSDVIGSYSSDGSISIDGLSSGVYNLYYEDSEGNKLTGYDILTGQSTSNSLEVV